MQQVKVYSGLLLVLFGTASFAQQPQFTATTSKERYSIKESIIIVYNLDTEGEDFKPPTFADFDVIQEPTRSTNMSVAW